MRHILVDNARASRRGKRDGGMERLPLDEGLVYSPAKSARLIALDEGLIRVARTNRGRRHHRLSPISPVAVAVC
jgi:hypothetical protein